MKTLVKTAVLKVEVATLFSVAIEKLWEPLG